MVYQIQNTEKHPTLFGSCTYSETDSRYSQPKTELYGVFQALKELWHQIWGIYFRIEVDAKFLLKMLHTPELPNAPMTWWLLSIQLFDFDLLHVLAEKHKVPDGLLRCKPSPLDSDNEDAEAYLDLFIGSSTVFSCLSITMFAEHFVHSGVLPDYDDALLFPTEYFTSWLKMQHLRLLGQGITYQMTTSNTNTLDISYFATVPNDQESTGVNMNIISNDTINPARDAYKFPNSLIACSLLSANNVEDYVGCDFFYRKVETEHMVDCNLGGELILICISEYSSCYITEPLYDDSPNSKAQFDNHTGYDLPKLE